MTERAVGFRARYDELEEARALFPRCVKCGRDLSAEHITDLVYVVGRNRFACDTCPTQEEPPHAA